MRLAVDRWTWWLAIMALTAACRPATPSRELADDLAQIEAELQRSDERLGEAGIVVAYRDARAPEGMASPPQESPPEPDASEPAPTEPTAPPEPTPSPTPEPTTPSTTIDEPSSLDFEEEAPLAASPRDRGRATRAPRAEHRRAKKSVRTRCERVCELSDTTCGLQDRVCTLASDHPDDVRYEDACRRAEDQCEAATRSCESCAA